MFDDSHILILVKDHPGLRTKFGEILTNHFVIFFYNSNKKCICKFLFSVLAMKQLIKKMFLDSLLMSNYRHLQYDGVYYNRNNNTAVVSRDRSVTNCNQCLFTKTEAYTRVQLTSNDTA